MPYLPLLYIGEEFVEEIVQETDGDCHNGRRHIVVDVPTVLEQPDEEIVAEESHRIDEHKPENQPEILVPENKCPISPEVEEHTDNRPEEVGPEQGVNAVDQTEQIPQGGENTPAYRRVQGRREQETDELRLQHPLDVFLKFARVHKNRKNTKMYFLSKKKRMPPCLFSWLKTIIFIDVIWIRKNLIFAPLKIRQ